MAYVSVAEWRPEQVTEWLKGLDNSIVSYIHWFSNNEINGQQLLNLTPDELTHLGVCKLGHQELILEAVQQLRNFHYDLDRENLQFLALKLSCAANSLYSEIREEAESSSVPTQIMADVANVIQNVKPLVSWLDRPPFVGQIQYTDYKSQLLSLSLEMATSAQRDRFAERPVAEIRTCSSKLAKLAESIIQDVTDPMILQPATLDLATIKKKAGEDLDFFLVPSFHGIHQIGDVKLSSSTHQSGKIQQGDEIVQVNYQTVVGWSRKKVLALFEESPNDLLLTLKRRPRHVKMYGQIYMKPYRLPSRKRASPYSRWNDNLPSPRPELLTIPVFDMTRNLTKKIESNQNLLLETSETSSSSDEEFGQRVDSQSPPSMRLYLSKPRTSIQRRFTLSGPPRPSAQSEQFWRELQLERSWRNNQSSGQINKSSCQNAKERNVDQMFQLRDKSASLGNSIASASSRPTTCVTFTNDRIGSVKFDLPKFEAFKGDKTVGGEKDKAAWDDIDKKSSETDENTFNGQSNTGTVESESNVGVNLSITELNKLKRNAFFNGMDNSEVGNPDKGKENEGGCNGSKSVIKPKQVKSNDRVKRVIENFNSEINQTKKDTAKIDLLKSPIKVMELVENFEKKENINYAPKIKIENTLVMGTNLGVNEKNSSEGSGNVSVTSYGAERKFFEKKCRLLDENGISDSKSKAINCFTRDQNTGEKFFSEIPTKSEIDSKSQMKENDSSVAEAVYVINKDIQEKKNFHDGIRTHHLCDKSGQNFAESFATPVFLNKKPETKRQNIDTTEISQDYKLSNSNENYSTCEILEAKNIQEGLATQTSENSEIKKPVPAQRKSKITPDINKSLPLNQFPLPPKPRTKSTTPLSGLSNHAISLINSDPPEPPPRPDNTFTKLVTTKKSEIAVEANKPEIKSHAEVTPLRPLAESSVSKGPFISTPILIVTPDTQPVAPDAKSLISTPTSPVRKLTKSKTSVSTTFLSSDKEREKEKEKSKTSGSTLESLKAILVLGRKQNINSPRSSKKCNLLLAKKRNISVKELIPFDNSGFLFYRNRKGLAVDWTKNYFVLQASNFYGFKSKESHKADLFIHLPGFTCSIADEVKSRDFSFKIYHTGTVFYFAADSKENLQQWLDSVNLAILYQEDKGATEAFTFSQTDSDSSESEPEIETCFPASPKIKKVLGTSSLPKPAKNSRSQQNTTSDLKKGNDVQRRFGSLKKLSSQKNSMSNSHFSTSGESTEVASLDRKYLRFLGQKNTPTPVPTSDFRSYRRIPLSSMSAKPGKFKNKSKMTENLTDSSVPHGHSMMCDPPMLLRRPLYSSNPSLVHPEMADYRITQERLSKFKRLRNQGNLSEQNRFMTLEQFLPEDNFRISGTRSQEFGGFITLEQFLLWQEEERQRLRKAEMERQGISNDLPRVRQTEDDRQNIEMSNRVTDDYFQGPSNNSSEGNCLNRSKRWEADKSVIANRNKESLVSSARAKMKNVNMLQFSSAQQPSSSNTQEEFLTLGFNKTFGPNHLKIPSYSESGTESNASRVSNQDGNKTAKSTKSSYQGIEYPPAFEPETYTLQHMLKNRRKRDQDFKK